METEFYCRQIVFWTDKEKRLSSRVRPLLGVWGEVPGRKAVLRRI